MTGSDFSLAQLAADGRIRPKDLDIVYVAYGEISRAAVGRYLDGNCGGGEPTDVARELTERICHCQHHDGGSTSLLQVLPKRITFRVEGPCTSCPQIRYTMGLLESAVHGRLDEDIAIEFEGVDRAGMQAPPGHQVTLAMLMHQTGMTFADIDRELARIGRLDDDDLVRLATRCSIRKSTSTT